MATAERVTDEIEGEALPYFNRELSWLDFNERVLELVEREELPLLERAKFLAIYATNLDEFFMVRVAGLHDQVDARVFKPGPDGLTPAETLAAVSARAREFGERHSAAFAEIRPQLAEAGIRIVASQDATPDELIAADRRFHEEVLPVLTPLAVGPGRPFPYISNLSLSLAVRLRDPLTGNEAFARVKVPTEVLPRFLSIGEGAYVPLEDLIAAHLPLIFPGIDVLACGAFRVTRDTDFTVSDEADDLVRAVEDELRRRRFGEIVRLEIEAGVDPALRAWLIEALGAQEDEVFDIDGLLDLTALWQLHDLEGHGDLRDAPWTPVTAPPWAATEDGPVDVFAEIRAADQLVHHPYDSFAHSVERFVAQAASDPQVLAIKMTVYRTSDDSALVPSLIEAAEAGKQAVCVVELKARFDERRNIEWARALEEAGVHVVYGLPGLKTHAKALLVVRREERGLRRYVHVGTDNYHGKTARLYEDFGLFTADPGIAGDIADMFNFLTGYGRPQRFARAIVSPEHSRRTLLEEIDRTIAAAEAGIGARILIKCNALVDLECIDALYRASAAGVRVDLNVRGICCLRPGVPGLSENIRVVSVVGRFLEHSRVYAFERNGDASWFIGSADLMPRNLDHRVELLVPVTDPRLTAELRDVLERCLDDDSFAWELTGDGSWHARIAGTQCVHAELMAAAHERASAAS